ncbi:hypothetical protein SAMN05421748_101705 [Paractinoplanes atraurantiacus]|uniref:Uncharacterized protein n=1 Tax=Paractinoplanes atraurantiacus TaxID=1036182 RepID=A0A285F6R4_9ACTN|nr:hypothetical protein SAMN05421748_101705 [Actinoplanes atraurantiacus]
MRNSNALGTFSIATASETARSALIMCWRACSSISSSALSNQRGTTSLLLSLYRSHSGLICSLAPASAFRMLSSPFAVVSASADAVSSRAIRLSSWLTKAAADAFSSGGHAATRSARAASSASFSLRTEPASCRHAPTCERAVASSSSMTIDHSRGVL